MKTLDDYIWDFQEGKDYFDPVETRHLGLLWVAKHTGYQTLTFEPNSGGQYEIAVRIWVAENNQWEGYRIMKFDEMGGFLVGFNTRGH